MRVPNPPRESEVIQNAHEGLQSPVTGVECISNARQPSPVRGLSHAGRTPYGVVGTGRAAGSHTEP